MTLGREGIDTQLVRQGAYSNLWIPPLLPQQRAPHISPVNDANLIFRVAEGPLIGLPALAARELPAPLVRVAGYSICIPQTTASAAGLPPLKKIGAVRPVSWPFRA